MIHGRAAIFAGLATIGAVVAGCAQFTSHPPLETMAGLTDARMEPIPTLMAESIRYTHQTHGTGSDTFAYNLPEGTSYEVYQSVARRLHSGRPMTEPMEPAYHVQSVRARGTLAEVDVLHPGPDAAYELVTISFRLRLFEGWRVDRTRTWRIPKEAPAPTYQPPIEPNTLAAAPTP